MKSLKYSVLIIGILTLPTMAQQQPNQQSPQPSEFNLRLKANDVNVIGKALGKLPFDEVAELLQSMRAQIIEQSVPKAVEPSIAPPNPPPFAQEKAK